MSVNAFILDYINIEKKIQQDSPLLQVINTFQLLFVNPREEYILEWAIARLFFWFQIASAIFIDHSSFTIRKQNYTPVL